MIAAMSQMLMYGQLAPLWPLLSPSHEYEPEAAVYRGLLEQHCQRPLQQLLELGSGGGHNARYLKQGLQMTLVDLSAAMLDVSKKLNPECEHLVGDMRTIRLNRQFDAVFVHDAIDYMATRDDMRAAIATAHAHCAVGGAVVLCPDHVKETFEPSTSHGGGDSDDDLTGLRFLEWDWDPDPSDDWFYAEFAYLIRDDRGEMDVVRDRHRVGLFHRQTWLDAIVACGFAAHRIDGADTPSGSDVFVGIRER